MRCFVKQIEKICHKFPFPDGYCLDASIKFSRYLRKRKISHELCYGTYKTDKKINGRWRRYHFWIEIDGIIYDATHGQFDSNIPYFVGKSKKYKKWKGENLFFL